MNYPKDFGRWFVAGVGVFALAGGGTVAATTPPTEPTDTEMGTTATTGAATGTDPGATGAGPSDCPPVTVETTSATEPGATDAAEATAPAATEAPAAVETTEAAAGTAATVAGTADAGSVPMPEGPFVQIAETDLYGPILVDSACRSLYAFMSDVDGEPTCVDECAEEWPPLFVPGNELPPLADELDPSLFGVVEHADGPMLKVGDWPLYYFEHDTAPGDTTGQGVGPGGEGFGGLWWLVAPDGTPIEEEAAGAATSTPDTTPSTDTTGAAETTTG
jgi:predicted lipoprotein with Yx(FWY)xxD motif